MLHSYIPSAIRRVLMSVATRIGLSAHVYTEDPVPETPIQQAPEPKIAGNQHTDSVCQAPATAQKDVTQVKDLFFDAVQEQEEMQINTVQEQQEVQIDAVREQEEMQIAAAAIPLPEDCNAELLERAAAIPLPEDSDSELLELAATIPLPEDCDAELLERAAAIPLPEDCDTELLELVPQLTFGCLGEKVDREVEASSAIQDDFHDAPETDQKEAKGLDKHLAADVMGDTRDAAAPANMDQSTALPVTFASIEGRGVAHKSESSQDEQKHSGLSTVSRRLEVNEVLQSNNTSADIQSIQHYQLQHGCMPSAELEQALQDLDKAVRLNNLANRYFSRRVMLPARVEGGATDTTNIVQEHLQLPSVPEDSVKNEAEGVDKTTRSASLSQLVGESKGADCAKEEHSLERAPSTGESTLEAEALEVKSDLEQRGRVDSGLKKSSGSDMVEVNEAHTKIVVSSTEAFITCAAQYGPKPTIVVPVCTLQPANVGKQFVPPLIASAAKAMSSRGVDACYYYSGRYPKRGVSSNVEEWRSRFDSSTGAKVSVPSANREWTLARKVRKMQQSKMQQRNNTNHAAGGLEMVYDYCNHGRTAPLIPVQALRAANVAFEDAFPTEYPFGSRSRSAMMARVVLKTLKDNVAANDWPIIRELLHGFHRGAYINDIKDHCSHRNEFFGCWREYFMANTRWLPEYDEVVNLELLVVEMIACKSFRSIKDLID